MSIADLAMQGHKLYLDIEQYQGGDDWTAISERACGLAYALKNLAECESTIPTVEATIVVAVSPGGIVDAIARNDFQAQRSAAYRLWREEKLADGCAISIVRCRVPVPEPLIEGQTR